jgi:hypothetical protein
MIPISQDDRLTFDDDKSGVRYFVKPITGDNELEFYRISKKSTKEMIKEELWPIVDELIDFFVTGWEGIGKKVNSFPENGKPSKYMTWEIKNKLIDFATQ